MKSVKGGLAILIVVMLVFILPSDARSGWLLTGGEEDIMVLLRVDSGDPDSPLHEQTQGKYGYWADSENFIVVIDFEGGSGPVSPFTWDDVKWVPGPMDKGWQGSS